MLMKAYSKTGTTYNNNNNNRGNMLVVGKRKYNPEGFLDTINNAALAVRDMGRKGGVSASDINIYGILLSVGPHRTVRSKKTDSNWSLTTAKHTMFIGSIDDVVVTPPVSIRDDYGNILVNGTWIPKSREELERLGQKGRQPSDYISAVIRPYSFVAIDCEVNSLVKPGDMVRLLNIVVDAIYNGPGAQYEESGFLKAKSIIKISTVTPRHFVKLCEIARIFTMCIPQPDLSTMGAMMPYTINPDIEMFCLMTGPNAYLEDPNGNVLILCVVDDSNEFVTGKNAPTGWKYKGQKPDKIVPIEEKDDEMCLKLSVGGAQRYYDAHSNTYYDSNFLLKMTLWNDGEMTLKKTGDKKWMTSQIYKFAIMDVDIWKSIMPVYFKHMNVVFFTRVNKKDTPRLMGALTKPSSSSYSSGGGGAANINEDAYNDPFGIQSAISVGGGADDLNLVDDDEAADDGGSTSQAGHHGGHDQEQKVDTSKLAKLNFAYAMYISFVSFDAKTFWSAYGLKISADLAQLIVKVTKTDQSKMIIDPGYTGKTPEILRNEKTNREKTRATITAKEMCCCCITKKTPGWSNLFDASGRGKFVREFRAVIPWPNLEDENDATTYAKAISEMDEDMQASLFLNTYNLAKKYVTDKQKAKDEKLYKKLKKMLTPPYPIGSDEWEGSPAAAIYEREQELAFDEYTPGIFAFWDNIQAIEDECLESIPKLTGDHETQRQYVERVRGPIVQQLDEQVQGDNDDDMSIEEPAEKKAKVSDDDDTEDTGLMSAVEQEDSSNDGDGYDEDD